LTAVVYPGHPLAVADMDACKCASFRYTRVSLSANPSPFV